MPLNWIGTVHNGIPLPEHPTLDHPTHVEPYLAWMGRMAPEKGVHLAIEFALRSGKKLRIAAQLVEEHRREYWEKQIKPLIDANPNLLEYIGEVGDPEKR